MNEETWRHKAAALTPAALAWIAQDGQDTDAKSILTTLAEHTRTGLPTGMEFLQRTHPFRRDRAFALFDADPSFADHCLTSFAATIGGLPGAAETPMWFEGLASTLIQAAGHDKAGGQAVADRISAAMNARWTPRTDNPFLPVPLDGEPDRIMAMAEAPVGAFLLVANARGGNSPELTQVMMDFLLSNGDPVWQGILAHAAIGPSDRVRNMAQNPNNIGPCIGMAGMFLGKQAGGADAANAFRAYVQRLADVDGPRTPKVDDAVSTLLDRFFFMAPR